MDVLRGLGDALETVPQAQREALKAALVAATAPYVAAREARMRAEGANEGDLPTSVYRNSKVIGRLGF
ncbi:MAG TPA: hypothetical protein PLL48_01970 [Novosphingobium sp.]|nr:hypothetical protein [Novosphingobium sp.]